ncbi:hypothetical protein COV06_03105 [Candidatus Uhrbacteria bacterium CG10_big_fil_rev_8_21_14_0_10_50_16]|uniref:NYN domain-containing protein n=1 Tax=Candidatus Uhrbacteria bacterium CG10_big_fil_rev_8_21_14_0_10_50_16 TaxID=1975039 RepID=A0A2H0RLW0_9BACT|nr:MAG: hypothetical protein COV06_03105 [Candidatus Uhrbacteria bacterium CG10_big_fil_rev_8_21_14_0_10_50_16]
MIHHKHQRVGVFIDVQNLYYSARNLYNRKVNFGNIVKKAVGARQLIRATAYVVSTKTGENQPFFDALNNLGIETKEKELMEYDGGQKKADWDVGITVDAISSAPDLDVIILVSGDGDYMPLIDYLHSRGKFVEVAAFRETTSSRLIEKVGSSNYINLSENKRSFLIPTGSHGAGTMVSDTTSAQPLAQEKVEAKPVVRSLSKPQIKHMQAPAPKQIRYPARAHVTAKPVDYDGLSPNERALNN